MVMKKNVKALGEYILVLSGKTEDTNSVLIMPKSAEDKSAQVGKVLAVGPDAKSVKTDMTVIFKKWAGTEVSVEEYADTNGEQKCFVVKESDILLIEEGGK